MVGEGCTTALTSDDTHTRFVKGPPLLGYETRTLATADCRIPIGLTRKVNLDSVCFARYGKEVFVVRVRRQERV